MDHKILQPLPEEISRQSSDEYLKLCQPITKSESYNELHHFIDSNLTARDTNDKVVKLSRTFNFCSVKQRLRITKSYLVRSYSERFQSKPHRRKTVLTGKERRELGLHRLQKTNQVYSLYLPVHEMWKKYACEMLGLEDIDSENWRASLSDSKTEALKTRLKKIEYFGCLMKVAKSRCPTYIGIAGIAIRETKCTFSFICKDNTVKTIPKMHSEFSFVLKNLCFSFMGNHIYQRTVERAKHTFKKHCLWL